MELLKIRRHTLNVYSGHHLERRKTLIIRNFTPCSSQDRIPMPGTGCDPLDSYGLPRLFRELFKMRSSISKQGIHSNGQIGWVQKPAKFFSKTCKCCGKFVKTYNNFNNQKWSTYFRARHLQNPLQFIL